MVKFTFDLRKEKGRKRRHTIVGRRDGPGAYKGRTLSASSDVSTGASGSGSPNAAFRRAFSRRYET